MENKIHRRRRFVTLGYAGTLVAGALLLFPTTAQAHSELVDTTPADGATLDQAPTEVILEFNDGVQKQGGAITVSGPNGDRYDVSNSFTASGATATVDVDEITESGRFTVTYRVVSADGHVVQGEYGFRLRGITSPSASPGTSPSSESPVPTVTPNASPAAQEDEGSGSVIWVLGLGAIGITLIAAMIAVFTRRGRG